MNDPIRTVFVLGAGASVQAGAPLMDDFLDRADELYQLGVPGIADAQPAFELVRQALSDLQAIHAKAYLDLDNIETLFSAVEMGRLIGKFPGQDSAGIEDLRNALIAVIVNTLERSIRFPVRQRHIETPRPFGEFAQLIEDLTADQTTPNRMDVSFLTFNYDILLDFALHSRRIPFDYWISESPNQDALPLLKLHGSINWGICHVCKAIVPYDVGEIRHEPFPNTKYAFFDLGSSIKTREHCGEHLIGTPFLVPPTWDKTAYQGELGQVWRKAAEVLGAAQNVFIIGYSLPETDAFFRYLFALGTQGQSRIRRFWIINPDEDGTVEQRFRLMIGRGIENRTRFINGAPGFFHVSIAELRNELVATR